MGLEPPKLRGASAETIGLDLIYERVHGYKLHLAKNEVRLGILAAILTALEEFQKCSFFFTFPKITKLRGASARNAFPQFDTRRK